MYRGRMDQPPETQTIPSWTLDVDSGILTAALCPRSGGREAILREIAGVFGGANDQHLGLLLASAASYVLDPTVDAKSAVRTAARFLAVSLSGRERSDLVDSTDGFCRALTAALCANMWSLTVHDMAPPDVFAIAHEPWMTQRGSTRTHPRTVTSRSCTSPWTDLCVVSPSELRGSRSIVCADPCWS